MEKELERFEESFEAVMTSDVVPMEDIMRYVRSARGKRLRPRLVFLSARLFGSINDSTRRTSLFVEMLHTATLIHDDVVDGSETRRGRDALHVRYDVVSAVLAGDYLLAKSLMQLSNPVDYRILQEMLKVAMMMCEGELIQNDLFHQEGSYLDIIERKTARLIRACCVGGALSVQAPEELVDRIGKFGLHLGLVFQMRDDILDDDSPETTAMAKQLLPEYLDKALNDLEAIAPFVVNKEAYSSLRELTVFCAERDH